MNQFLLTIILSIPFMVHSMEMPLIGGPTYLSEEQKINQLILFVEKSEAKFVRNGTAYSGMEAAKHLKMKREKAGAKIKTAKDFIDLIASKSSMSGEAYLMLYKNGKTIPVRDILYNELRKMDAKQVGFKITKVPAC
jgi:hypothetical protein